MACRTGHLPLVMPRTTKSATPPLVPNEAYDIPDDFVGWGGVLDLPETHTW